MENNSRAWSRLDARRRPYRGASLVLVIAVTVMATALGCGGSDSSAPAHPDTGVGAGETAPAAVSCVDLCLRNASCAGSLCNEDTMSTMYTAVSQLAASQCGTVCAGVQVPAITATQWQCLFQSSCRQVFEHDACGVGARYSCSS
jgi:hypothetical protein